MQRLELVLQLEGSRGRRVDKQTNALRYRGLSWSTKILALIRWGQFGALVCICGDPYGGILFLGDLLVTFQNFKLAPRFLRPGECSGDRRHLSGNFWKIICKTGVFPGCLWGELARCVSAWVRLFPGNGSKRFHASKAGQAAASLKILHASRRPLIKC